MKVRVRAHFSRRLFAQASWTVVTCRYRSPQSALPQWTGASSTDGPVESWGTTVGRVAVRGLTSVIVTIGQRQGFVLGDEPADDDVTFPHNACS
jgi:hypothetical protein